jgi:hypothetical protein
VHRLKDFVSPCVGQDRLAGLQCIVKYLSRIGPRLNDTGETGQSECFGGVRLLRIAMVRFLILFWL